jgi:hypothetical protein
MRASRCRAGNREKQFEALALRVIAVEETMDRRWGEGVVTIC